MQDEMQQLTIKQGIDEVSLLHYPTRNVKKYHELHTDKARKSRCASSDIFSPAAPNPDPGEKRRRARGAQNRRTKQKNMIVGGGVHMLINILDYYYFCLKLNDQLQITYSNRTPQL